MYSRKSVADGYFAMSPRRELQIKRIGGMKQNMLPVSPFGHVSSSYLYSLTALLNLRIDLQVKFERLVVVRKERWRWRRWMWVKTKWVLERYFTCDINEENLRPPHASVCILIVLKVQAGSPSQSSPIPTYCFSWPFINSTYPSFVLLVELLHPKIRRLAVLLSYRKEKKDVLKRAVADSKIQSLDHPWDASL